MDKVAALLQAMFPARGKAGWPSFLECVSNYELRFEEPVLRWVGDVLDKSEFDISDTPVGETLSQLSLLNYQDTTRFKSRALELYFGSPYFVSLFTPNSTSDSERIHCGVRGAQL